MVRKNTIIDLKRRMWLFNHRRFDEAILLTSLVT